MVDYFLKGDVKRKFSFTDAMVVGKNIIKLSSFLTGAKVIGSIGIM